MGIELNGADHVVLGFNALIEFNAVELIETFGVPVHGREWLADSISNRWDPSLRTWTDPETGSGGVRTLDAQLALLVDPRPEAFTDLFDPAAFGSHYGPSGAHRDEPTLDPDTYWRGPNWPQLTYLLAVAAQRAGLTVGSNRLMASLRRSAVVNDFAEYWNPYTGDGGGAAPQTWSTLACAKL